MSAPVEDKVEEEKTIKRVRTAYDVQRAKLEKLMKDPSKPVFIPTPRNEKDPNKAPDFVYNVSVNILISKLFFSTIDYFQAWVVFPKHERIQKSS